MDLIVVVQALLQALEVFVAVARDAAKDAVRAALLPTIVGHHDNVGQVVGIDVTVAVVVGELAHNRRHQHLVVFPELTKGVELPLHHGVDAARGGRRGTGFIRGHEGWQVIVFGTNQSIAAH